MPSIDLPTLCQRALLQPLKGALNPHLLLRHLLQGWQLPSMITHVFMPLSVVSALLWRFQRRLIFAPPPRACPFSLFNMQLLRLNTDDPSAGPAMALYAPARSPSAPTVVYFHGDGEQLGWTPVHIAEHFVRRGCGFLAVEFPGYGLAKEGTPSEANCYRVARAALGHLVAPQPYGLGVPKHTVILVGHSLGCGVALEMSLQGFGGRMVLISPFTSVLDMLRLKLWPLSLLLPLSMLCTDKFDNLHKASRVTIPTCVIHSKSDVQVPVNMGLRVAQAIPNAQTCVLDGCGGDIFAHPRLAHLVDLVLTFAHGASDSV
eukprot:EG_transcript_20395